MALDPLTIAQQGIQADSALIALQGLLDKSPPPPPAPSGGGKWDWDWHEKRRRAEEDRLRRAREELGIIPAQAKGPPSEPETGFDDPAPVRRPTLSLKPKAESDAKLGQALQSAIRLFEQQRQAEQVQAREHKLVVERRKRRTIEAKDRAEQSERQRLADDRERLRLRRIAIENDDIEVLTLFAQFMN